MTRARHGEVPCTRCNGNGARVYGSTATWRGGIGGASMTWDICDLCWGSGEEHRPWTDIRKLERTFETRVKQEAITLLARVVGAQFSDLKPAAEEIATELERLSRSRKPRPYYFHTLCSALALTIRKGVSGSTPTTTEAE